MDMNAMKALTGAIDAMDKDVLRDTLAYLLKVYVIDKGLSYEGKGNPAPNPHLSGGTPSSFVELIRGLKSRYSMEELNVFSVEGENVFITLEGKTYQLTQNKNTVNTEKVSGLKNNDISGEKKTGENTLSSAGRFEKLELE